MTTWEQRSLTVQQVKAQVYSITTAALQGLENELRPRLVAPGEKPKEGYEHLAYGFAEVLGEYVRQRVGFTDDEARRRFVGGILCLVEDQTRDVVLDERRRVLDYLTAPSPN
jgi:hypothetical protein